MGNINYVLENEDNISILIELDKKSEIKISDINLWILIENLASILSESDLKKSSVQIGRDWLLGSLRKMDLLYSYINSSKNLDEREIFLVSYFHYFKSFIEIMNFNYKKIIHIENNLKKWITDIRNLFMHSYEKKINNKIYFVRMAYDRFIIYNDINWFEKDYIGIDILSIFFFENKKFYKNNYFSINLFHYELIKLTNKLILKLWVV